MATYFPICCLQNLYEHLHSSHHLKHDGRHQLRLFLKVKGGQAAQEAELLWPACCNDA